MTTSTNGPKYQPVLQDGIKAFRWAKSVDDVHAVLANPAADEIGAVPLPQLVGHGLPAPRLDA
jgi:hypothetical protein